MSHLKKDGDFCWWLQFFSVVKMHDFHQILKGGCELKKDKNNYTRELVGRGQILSAGVQ